MTIFNELAVRDMMGLLFIGSTVLLIILDGIRTNWR